MKINDLLSQSLKEGVVVGMDGKPINPSDTDAPAASPTGDATLDKPLAPKDPNAPGIGTKIGQGVGQAAKAVGAVGGGIAGIGRAIKKGFQAGADTVGGPGAAKAPAAASTAAPGAGGTAAGGSPGNVTDQEFTDLIARVQKLEQLLAMRR